MSRLENSDWILLFKWNEKSTQFFVGFNPYKSRKWTFYLKNVDVRKEMLTLADDSIQPICIIIGGWSKEKFNQITLYGTNLRFRRGFSLNNLRDLVFIRDGCLYISIHDDYGLLFYHHKKRCMWINFIVSGQQDLLSFDVLEPPQIVSDEMVVLTAVTLYDYNSFGVGSSWKCFGIPSITDFTRKLNCHYLL